MRHQTKEFASRNGNRDKITIRVVGKAAVEGVGHRARHPCGAEQKGLARPGCRVGLCGEDGSGAGPVVRRECLAETLTEPLSQEPRKKINPRSRRPRVDQPHWPIGPGSLALGECWPGANKKP